jgi:hypothetical protein
MSKQAEYMVGWIDTTIHGFLLEVEEPTSSMAYALVTCLDSSFEVTSMLEQSKQLSGLKGKCHPVGQGILLTTRQLLAAERHNRLFFGFDEVWFFPTSEVEPKPESLVLTGPEKVSPHEIEQYSEWMRSSNCSLGLGDGAGMNFCLRIRGAARYILKAYNEASLHSLEQERESA